jgi:hypothetical protein
MLACWERGMLNDSENKWAEWGLKLLLILLILLAVMSIILYFLSFDVLYMVAGLFLLICALLLKREFKITFFEKSDL